VADAGRQYFLHVDEDLMPLVETGDAETSIKVWHSAGGYRAAEGEGI